MLKFSADDATKPELHGRLAAALFVALLVLALLAAFAVFRHLVANEERQTENTLNHIADIRTAAVSAWVLERVSDARVFGSDRFLGETVHSWVVRGAPDNATRRRVQEQLKAIKASYGYVEVAILDGNGRALASALDSTPPLDSSAVRTVLDALATGDAQVSSIHPGTNPGSQSQVIDIATPLLHTRGDPEQSSAVLYLKANADLPLDPFVHSLPLLSASTEVLLADIRGAQVVAMSATEGARRFRTLDVLPIEPEQLVAATAEPVHHLTLYSPRAGVSDAVARRVTGTPWFLVTLVDENELRGNLRRLALIVAGAYLGVLALLGLAFLLWWRKSESEFRLQALRRETEWKLLQRQYDYLSKYANDMIVLADAAGDILDINDKTLHVLGYESDTLAGKPLSTLFAPASRPLLQHSIAALGCDGSAFFEVEQQRVDGSTLPVEISARAIRSDERQFIQLIGRDISERKQAEAALRENQARLDSILASVTDVVWSFSADLSRINYISPPSEKLYGIRIAEFMADPQLWLDAVHEEDRPVFQARLHGLGPEHPFCEAEFRVVRRDGAVRWVHCRAHLVADTDGRPLRIDGVTTDITQRKYAEQQVQSLAYYDNVTTLPNRTLITDRLAQAMHMATRSNKKVTVLFMDLDNFKNVNDSLGHHIGDMLLRAIGERLLQCVREEDTVGRLGGDEFLVVLPDIERGEQAVAVAEKILASMAKPFTLQGQQIHTTISIGISVFPEDGTDPNVLIRHADSALYQAKGRGRDNYQFFTQELNYQITRSLNIERQLRHAIDAGELSVCYQPQVNLQDGALIGAEALLRWRHDGVDFLSPVEFIPVAEERGLIGKIGEWVLREACGQARRWQAQGLPLVPIAVNVSPLQFQQKGFAALVTGILDETHLDASCLELEITESAIMRRAPLVAALAATLRKAGVGISIDDFGTGYSSLSYLKQIPIDKIKIDRSFIADMLDDSDDEAITVAIINLAHSLNLRVIAEGVETHAQLERLRSFGCNEVQGYYYSSAVDADAFGAILANRTVHAAAHA